MSTKDEIMNGYVDLVLKESTSKVSVTEICRQCNVSRKTFYYYFIDRCDLLESIFIEDVEIPLKIAMEKELTARDYLLTFYKHFLLKRDFYIIAMKENGQNSMFENIIERLEKINIKKYEPYLHDVKQREYVAYKFAASQAMLLKKWMLSGMVESPEFMADVFLMTLAATR